jgi:integrase
MLNRRASAIILMSSLGTHSTFNPFPSRDSTEKAIQRMKQRFPDAPADVERITPKMMRQWFASKICGDVAENVLQALLGHAPGSKVTRMHYVRSNEAQRVDAVSALKMP